MMEILIIEKNKKTAANLAESLKKSLKDIIVHICLSGTDGLRTLKRRSFDLVITGDMLKDMTGFEFMEGLADIGGRWPIIVIGNSGKKDDAAEFVRRGAYNYIIRDASLPKSLVSVARRALELSCIFADKSDPVKDDVKFTKNKEVSRVAHILNHELNSPLMAIIGSSQLLLNRKEIAADELRTKLLLIEESALRMARVMAFFADGNYDHTGDQPDSDYLSEDMILAAGNSTRRWEAT